MTAWLQRILFRLRGLRIPAIAPQHDDRCAAFTADRIASLDEYRRRIENMGDETMRREEVERHLASSGEVFPVSGHCCVCRRDVTFHVDRAYGFGDADGSIRPNWRERVVCPLCRLNNRMRAAIHFFQSICTPPVTSRIYLTEQTTPLFRRMAAHYPAAVGSEYLGTATPFGTNDPHGIRNESLAHLSFPAASFDYILSFDVFEHIPNYLDAFAECLRCLRPGGAMVFTVPFAHVSQDNIVRARIGSDSAIVHLLPPEYHGDPMNSAGCLCFYHFGWKLLDELRTLGFADTAAYFYWSRELGYLGGDQMIFLARSRATGQAGSIAANPP